MHNEGEDVPDDFIDQWCWVRGTYTTKFNVTEGVKSINTNGCDIVGSGTECWHHIYYQWVPLALIVQAGFFYFPKYLWDAMDDGKVKTFVEEIDQKTKLKQRGEPFDKFYAQRREHYKTEKAESSPLAFVRTGFYKAIRDRLKGDGYFK